MPHQPGHVAPNEPIDEFEIMRRRLKARGAAGQEGQQRQLNRQFASLGNLPSGAAFKIRQQAQVAGERQVSENLQDVNVLQAQTQRAEREAEKQRTFQTGERIGSQQFAGTQAGLQRGFQTAERLGGEKFQTGQQTSAQQFQTSERKGTQTFTAEQQAIADTFSAQQQTSAQNFAAGQQISAQDFQSGQNLLNREFSSEERKASEVFVAAESLLGRNFTQHEATLARDFAREEAATGRSYAEIQAGFQREHESRMQVNGIASNEHIALLDRNLQKQGLDINRLIAESQIATAELEGTLNSFATFVNSMGPLGAAGLNPNQIAKIYGELDLGIPTSIVSTFISQNFPEFGDDDPFAGFDPTAGGNNQNELFT